MGVHEPHREVPRKQVVRDAVADVEHNAVHPCNTQQLKHLQHETEMQIYSIVVERIYQYTVTISVCSIWTARIYVIVCRVKCSYVRVLLTSLAEGGAVPSS